MSTNFHLKHKTILVSAATSGIGVAVTEQLNNAGANLFLHGRNQKKLKELSSFGTIVAGDLNGKGSIVEIVKSVGELDGLVLAAGVMKAFPTKLLKEKQIGEIFKTNFESAVLLVSELLQNNKLRPGASIVFVSSLAAQIPFIGGAMYAASKAALSSYSKTLALELADQNIRANCVAPGLVKTEMLNGVSEKWLEEMSARYPLGLGEPKDIAGLIHFLLSDEAKWITGAEFKADGGFSIH